MEERADSSWVKSGVILGEGRRGGGEWLGGRLMGWGEGI